MQYDFSILVSCHWGWGLKAKEEIRAILAGMGDDRPDVKLTLARGIVGVKTSLDSRSVINALHETNEKDSSAIKYALKWVPVDLWVSSEIESIKEGLAKLTGMIAQDETWRMTVEKRRYTALHKIDVIREAAELIDQRVDLENPDKIVRIDIIGPYAGIAVLRPKEIFSVLHD